MSFEHEHSCYLKNINFVVSFIDRRGKNNHEYVLFHVILVSLSFVCSFVYYLTLHGSIQVGYNQNYT